MKSIKFIVVDTYGNAIRIFYSYQSASTYKYTFGNENWTIKQL